MDIERIRILAGLTTNFYSPMGTVNGIQQTIDQVLNVVKTFVDFIKDQRIESYYATMTSNVDAQNGKWLHDSNELKVYEPTNWVGYESIINCCDEYFVNIIDTTQYVKFANNGKFIFVLSYDQIYLIYISNRVKQCQHFAANTTELGIQRQLLEDFPVLRMVLREVISQADESTVEAGEFLCHFKLTLTDLDVMLIDHGKDGLLDLEDKLSIYPNQEMNQIFRNWHMFSGFADQHTFKVGNVAMFIHNPNTKKHEQPKYEQSDDVLWFTDNNIIRSYGSPRDIFMVWDYILQKMCILFGLEYDQQVLKDFILEAVYYYRKTGRSILKKV